MDSLYKEEWHATESCDPCDVVSGCRCYNFTTGLQFQYCAVELLQLQFNDNHQELKRHMLAVRMNVSHGIHVSLHPAVKMETNFFH